MCIKIILVFLSFNLLFFYFSSSPVVSSIDPFRIQKENSFHGSDNAIATLLTHLKAVLEMSMNDIEMEDTFFQLLQVIVLHNSFAIPGK
jgi:hypothetical protein